VLGCLGGTPQREDVALTRSVYLKLAWPDRV